MAEPLRLRVVFDDRKMLTKSHRSNSLKRSWVLLKPGSATISDVASQVTKKFKLKRSCPNGVVLYMEDFVLPLFESICLLKDSDIIRIGKRDVAQIDEMKVGGGPQYIQDSQFVKNQRMDSSDGLLAIQQFDEDSSQHKRKNDCYLSAHIENAIRTAKSSSSKKRRKHSDKIQGSKKKKLKTSAAAADDDDDEATCENDEDIHIGKSLGPSQGRGCSHIAFQLEDCAGNVTSSMQRIKRNDQSEENVGTDSLEKSGNGQSTEMEKQIVPVVSRPGHIRFQPSDEEQMERLSQETPRTAQWNRTSSMKGQKWGNLKSLSKQKDANGYNYRYTGKGIFGNEKSGSSSMLRVLDEQSNGKVISEAEKKTVQWNGTTSTKRQKWGKLKSPSKLNDASGYNDHYNGKGISGKETSGTRNILRVYDEQSNGKVISEAEKAESSSTHFESLPSLARLPQVGDVLAYRLIELLSSSGRSEISSFRVGQVKSFNCISMFIFLIPFPGYPIFPDEDVERNEVRASPYNEDGSLQIHYPSLVDVHLLEVSVATNSNHARRGTITQNNSSVNNWELALANSSGTNETAVTQPSENQNAGWSTWDKIKQTITEKKAQLEKKNVWDEWTPNKSNNRASWSYSASRGRSADLTFSKSRGRKSRPFFRR